MRKILLLTIFSAIFPLSSYSETTETFKGSKYIAEITSHCEEGNISCKNVTLISKSIKTKQSIELKGETVNINCPGTCDFRGYTFKNKNYIYTLLSDNHQLNKWNYIIMEDDKIISKDHGIIE
ncbi:hypothetical protein [Brenneria corticis]|uniref:hypothetical protein n=1 Tax=Brenneria corticis TaxID=2173106 RepID=UPI00109E0871|nr:hypothetical protein [Brenneria sp. CFCC 11842]